MSDTPSSNLPVARRSSSADSEQSSESETVAHTETRLFSELGLLRLLLARLLSDPVASRADILPLLATLARTVHLQATALGRPDDGADDIRDFFEAARRRLESEAR